MNRHLALIIGVLCYAFFFVTFLYFIGFMTGLVVPIDINDNGQAASSTGMAIVINVLLLGAFAVQHTIMARPEFKKRWITIVPAPIERAVFVLTATALVALLMWQWRPITSVIWRVEAEWARWLLNGVSLLGFGIVLISTFLIDHFDLFGLRQVVLYAQKKPYTHPPFVERSLYKLIRHPLMAGFIIAFWATPDMTGGHLLFAVVTTAYILIGIRIEERDLVRFLGDDYLEYRKRTPALIPFTRRRPAPDAPSAESE